MQVSTRNARSVILLVLLGILIVIPSRNPSHAQDSPEAAAAQPATTSSDPDIDVDRLRVVLRPLTREQLDVELQGWLNLLQSQIRQVGEIELELKNGAEDEPQDDLKSDLITMRTAERDLVERTRIVADALKVKGGDSEKAEQFISAVSDISETTDTTSLWAASIATFTNWIGRDDGGQLWAKRVVTAIVTLLFFVFVSSFSGRITAKLISRHPRTSVLLENFARRTTGGIVFVVGILMSLSSLGVQIGPMMAALGAGGFIVGFALQETLGSFASGMMIMIYQPFDVDDYICVAGVEGKVREMSLVSTTLLTIDNKVLVIPNKKAWSDTIINYTGQDLRRVDMVFGIGYDDDMQHATEVLYEIASEHELVLDDPPVQVHVGELADSSVNLLCRPWVNTPDYWTVYWDITRRVKERFDAEGISFPFPQRDVHMHPEPVTT